MDISKHRIKRLCIPLSCLLLILLSLDMGDEILCSTARERPPDFTIIYSGNINGYYKPCG